MLKGATAFRGAIASSIRSAVRCFARIVHVAIEIRSQFDLRMAERLFYFVEISSLIEQ